MRSREGARTMATKQVKCAEKVWHQDGNWGQSYQCRRNAGYGPDKAYCRQHAEKFTTEGDTVTWYRASCYSDYSCEIRPVEVLKELDKTLLVKDGKQAKRENKESQWYRYFPERQRAVEFYRGRIRGLRAQANKLEAKLNEIANQGVNNVSQSNQ